MPCNTRCLPLGRVSFSNIRKNARVYVDKTEMISKIAELDTPIFFSRPRRFGKSLLINTFHTLFEKGLDDFCGLDIEKIWSDSVYKVVDIDFSRMIDNNIRDIKFTLSAKIISEFGLPNSLIESNSSKIEYPDILLDEALDKIEDNSIVLLIDEYDAPLTHNLGNNVLLQDIIILLDKFYATIKQYTDKFRFVFITGITRVSHLSIFSSFNNLVDLSLKREFNTLLGFTHDDIEKYFDQYIKNAANILHISISGVYQRLEQYYDGFQFSPEAEKTVYNPWSVLSFFKFPEDGFKNYWFNSGGIPSIISKYIKNNNFDIFDYKKKQLSLQIDDLSRRYEIDNIPQEILLYQTGYFSIRNGGVGFAHLILPNLEIEDSLLLLYLTENNIKLPVKIRKKLNNLSKAIDDKNLIEIIDVFNEILNECVSCLSNIFKDERSIRDIIYAALIHVPTLQKIKERETVAGRSDLELITDTTCLCIEFKRTLPDRSPEASLHEAVEQMQSRHYGRLFSQVQDLYCVAMVVSTEKKMILKEFCKEVC